VAKAMTRLNTEMNAAFENGASVPDLRLPTTDDVVAVIRESTGPGEVMDRIVTSYRVNLTKFIGIRMGAEFDRLKEDIRGKVLASVVETDPMPRLLAHTLPATGSEDKEALMRAFCEDVLDDFWHPGLKGAFRGFLEFQFSYDSHLHYLVRGDLKRLDPFDQEHCDLGEVTKTVFGSGKTVPEKAEHLQRVLFTKVLEYMFDLQKALTDPKRGIGRYPYLAVAAAAEEMIDQITYADTARTEWRRVLRAHRNNLWPAEYEELEKDARVYRDWARLARECEDAIAQLSDARDGLNGGE